MKWQAVELLAKMKLLQFGVAKTPTLLQSECVIFQAGRAYTFSGDVFAIVKCDVGFEGVVEYKHFLDILKNYGDETIDVSLLSGTSLQIKRGRSKTKLSLDPVILLSISSVANPSPDNWLALPDGFAEAVKACESVARITPGDGVLSSINITPSWMEAASSAQIIRYFCSLKCQERFLVKTGLLGKLLKASPTKYQATSSWLFLRSPEVVFAVPTFSDDFIDGIDLYLRPGEYNVTFPKELLRELPVVRTVLGKEETVKVILGGNVCKLEAVGAGGSHFAEADMDVPNDLPSSLCFSLSPDLLAKIVSSYPNCTVSKNGIRVQNDLFSYAASVE